MTLISREGFASEMAKIIGQYGMLADRGMEYQVQVVEVRMAWGKLQLQVRPMVGNGEAWVDASSFRQLPAATS